VPYEEIVENMPRVICSYTDGEYNFYLLDLGRVHHTHITTLGRFHFTGQTGSLSIANVTTESLTHAAAETVSNSVTFTDTRSNTQEAGMKVKVNARIPFVKSTEVTAHWKGSWTTTNSSATQNAASLQTSVQAVQSVANTVTMTYNYSLANGDALGHYRVALYATSQVFFIVTTNRDNTEWIGLESIVVPRAEIMPRHTFCEDGFFDNSPLSTSFDIQYHFYRYLAIPQDPNYVGYVPQQKQVTITFDVDGGNLLLPITVDAGSAIVQLPHAVRTGRYFVGWFNYQGQRISDEQGNLGGTIFVDYSKILTARWATGVSNQAELNQIRFSPTENFVLTSDIMLTGEWVPIAGFSGNLDGRGHTISGLRIVVPTTRFTTGMYFGLFGRLTGSVYNLRMTNVNITGNAQNSGSFVNVGAVAASLVDGSMRNIHVSGRIDTFRNNSRIGGIVGYSIRGSLTSVSIIDLTIRTSGDAGGIAGLLHDSTISNINAMRLTIDSSGVSASTGGIAGIANASTVDNAIVVNINILLLGGIPRVGLIIGSLLESSNISHFTIDALSTLSMSTFAGNTVFLHFFGVGHSGRSNLNHPVGRAESCSTYNGIWIQ